MEEDVLAVKEDFVGTFQVKNPTPGSQLRQTRDGPIREATNCTATARGKRVYRWSLWIVGQMSLLLFPSFSQR